MIPKYKYWFFQKALSNKVCQDIIDFGMSQPSGLGIIKGADHSQEEVLKATRNSYVSFNSAPWIYNIIHPFIAEANKNAGWNYQWDFTEPVQFTKYGLNQYYHWHQDYFEEPYVLSEKIQNENFLGKVRKLSCVVSLTDSSEYQGGEFEFANTHVHSEKTKVYECLQLKPKGSILVFPSFIWHRVKPVTQGTRMSLVSWSLGDPFK